MVKQTLRCDVKCTQPWHIQINKHYKLCNHWNNLSTILRGMLEIALLISAFSMSAKWKPIRWHMFMASVHCSRTLKNMKQDLPNHPAQLTPKNTEDITKHILVYICVYGHPCIWCEMNQLYQMPFTQSFIHYANNTAFKMRMHKNILVLFDRPKQLEARSIRESPRTVTVAIYRRKRCELLSAVGWFCR